MKTKKNKDSSRHKHKKSKKHKKQKTRSSSDSDSSEMEWVEAPPLQTETLENKREQWMSEEAFVPVLSKDEMKSGSSSRERKKIAQMQELEKEEAIKQERELNPHWKNSGCGLPDNESTVESLHLPSTSVGDGGYAYLRKAYLRILEQSQQGESTMEEIAVERWGSLDKLVSLIDEAESRMKTLSHDRYQSTNEPETYRFKKPQKERNQKRNFLISSSSDRRRNDRYRNDPLKNFLEEDDNTSSYAKKSASSRTDEKYRQNDCCRNDSRNSLGEDNNSSYDKKNTNPQKRDYMAWERSRLSSDSKLHVPAWKKVKHNKDDDEKLPSFKKSESPKRFERPTDKRPSEECIIIKSENDLNRLAANYLKADLLGDTVTAMKLKAELDEAREKFKAEGVASVSREKSYTQDKVLLTKIDSSGQQQPVHSAREEAGFERQSGKKKRSGKYFDDTSRYSLKQMFEREKLITTDENMEMFVDVAAECIDKKADDEEETSTISKKAHQKMSHSVQEEKDIGRAIQQHQKMNSALAKCEYCLDQPNMKQHLIVSISEKVYLCLPNYQSLTEHHCLIVPKRHVQSFLALDEDEWNEVESMLRRFFMKQEKSLLCVETSMSFRRYPHAVLECIPVPIEDGDMAPLYFKKALLESEEEWTHNVKLIDLSKKGLRRSVPKNLPYFCVTFDPSVHAGYAHVIEDENYFPRNFGKEVIGGIIDIDYNYLYKNRKDNPVKKSKEALQFTGMLEEFQEADS
ncbi:CWF19-like protein 2 [Caerostris extrusa]|uniref:CWF19-like protein 2 n=1 Tax=Caerostris extrusa TaxID=172846 RepID=A0AAV4SS51_CAEEX|nr:CWF19-like protein 2 [Caerostris extrusa]